MRLEPSPTEPYDILALILGYDIPETDIHYPHRIACVGVEGTAIKVGRNFGNFRRRHW